MRRGATCGLLLVLAVSGGARAQDDDVPQLRFWPGLGVGFLGLSLELNVEGQRWYGGAQLAAAASYSRLAVNGYVGVRAGAFLSDAAAAPFVGAGVGYLYQNPLIGEERGEASSDGWGASVEVGMAYRRDQRWFHPQLVAQAIVPFAQHTTSPFPPSYFPIFLIGVRLFF